MEAPGPSQWGAGAWKRAWLFCEPIRSLLYSRPRQIALVGVLVLLVGRVWLAVVMWEPGWSALTWDDFTRVQLARHWAIDPEFAPGGDLVWLPAPTWINGLAFMAVGGSFRANPMLLTAIVNTVAAIAAAAIVGWSAHRLWRSLSGGLLAFAAVLF